MNRNEPLLCDLDADFRTINPDWPWWLSIEVVEATCKVIERGRDSLELLQAKANEHE